MTDTTQGEDLSIPENLRRAAPAKPAVAATPAPAKEPKAKKAKAAKPAKQAKAKGKDAPAKNPRSIVPVKFKTAYAQNDDTCGSKLALALKAATTTENKDGRPCLDVAQLTAIAKANGVWNAKYADLNNGQKRMNVGNKLAGKIKAGETVVIGKQKFASETALKAAVATA